MARDLNELYVEHKKNGGQAEQFMSSIAKAVYTAPQHYGFKDIDEVGEAFAVYWVRILGVIDRYQDTGSCFDAYLATTLRYIAASIRRSMVYKLESQRVVCDSLLQPEAAQVEPAFCLEPGKPDLPKPLAADGRPRRTSRKVLNQRILFLCAKSALQIRDDELVNIAVRIGYDADDLIAKVAQVRSLATRVHARRQARMERRNRSWVRSQMYRRQLAFETDPVKRQRLSDNLARQEQMHRQALQDLATAKQSISNGQIAQIFGVSKSTVDSGLDRLRRMYEQ